MQQPGPLTSCGFHSDKVNRRVIDPCPIVQLAVKDSDGQLRTTYVQNQKLGADSPRISALGNISVMVASVVLVSLDGKQDSTFVNVSTLAQDPRYAVYAEQIRSRTSEGGSSISYERLLDGSAVSTCHLLTDLMGNRGAYFIFEDLAVRMDGTYRLCISLSDLIEYAILY